MSNIALLTESEQEKFDKPPTLPVEIRSICFSLTQELESQIKRLHSPTNKVGFLLQYGFFKACKKFFSIGQFSKEDIKFVAHLLGISNNQIDLSQYKNKIPSNHQAIILNLSGYKPFDLSVIKWLQKEIKPVVKQFSEPREIFFQVLLKLHNQQIEIPSYYRLAELISSEYLNHELSTLSMVEKNISKKQRESLDTLLDPDESGSSLLNQLKHITHIPHTKISFLPI